MFTLVLILLLVGLTLGAALFVGGLFVQGYIYTEPSPHLTWGAPIAGAVLFLFYSAWCLAVAFSTPSAENSTYHVIWQFSPTVNQFRVPVKEVWAVRKGDRKERYVLKKVVMFAGQARPVYRSADTDRPWNNAGVEAIVLRPRGAGICAMTYPRPTTRNVNSARIGNSSATTAGSSRKPRTARPTILRSRVWDAPSPFSSCTPFISVCGSSACGCCCASSGRTPWRPRWCFGSSARWSCCRCSSATPSNVSQARYVPAPLTGILQGGPLAPRADLPHRTTFTADRSRRG